MECCKEEGHVTHRIKMTISVCIPYFPLFWLPHYNRLLILFVCFINNFSREAFDGGDHLKNYWIEEHLPEFIVNNYSEEETIASVHHSLLQKTQVHFDY